MNGSRASARSPPHRPPGDGAANASGDRGAGGVAESRSAPGRRHAVRCSNLRPRSPRLPAVAGMNSAAPARRNPAVVFAHRLIADAAVTSRDPCLQRRTALRAYRTRRPRSRAPQHIGERTRAAQHLVHRLAAAGADQIVGVLAFRQQREHQALARLQSAATPDRPRDRPRAARPCRRRSTASARRRSSRAGRVAPR